MSASCAILKPASRQTNRYTHLVLYDCLLLSLLFLLYCYQSYFGFIIIVITIIAVGVLECKDTPVEEIMVSMDRVYMLSSDAKLDQRTMSEMMGEGHSRIPVYDQSRHNIRGILLVKQLIVLSPDDARPVNSLVARLPLFVGTSTGLLEMLALFQKQHSHFAVVCNRPDAVSKAIRDGKPIPPHIHMAGIVTIEDVVERILKSEILDETDDTDGIRNRLKIANRISRLKQLVEIEKKKSQPKLEVTTGPEASTSSTTPLLSSDASSLAQGREGTAGSTVSGYGSLN